VPKGQGDSDAQCKRIEQIDQQAVLVPVTGNESTVPGHQRAQAAIGLDISVFGLCMFASGEKAETAEYSRPFIAEQATDQHDSGSDP